MASVGAAAVAGVAQVLAAEAVRAATVPAALAALAAIPPGLSASSIMGKSTAAGERLVLTILSTLRSTATAAVAVMPSALAAAAV
jgi:hypothetical protein